MTQHPADFYHYHMIEKLETLLQKLPQDSNLHTIFNTVCKNIKELTHNIKNFFLESSKISKNSSFTCS